MTRPLLFSAAMAALVLTALTLPGDAQSTAHCTGIALDADARCGCIRDPNSQLCDLVKRGFYDTNGQTKLKGIDLGFNGVGIGGLKSSGSTKAAPRAATHPAQPRQARVVALTHKDYLRFLHPNAQLIAGGSVGKLMASPELSGAVFGATEGGDAQARVLAAMQEMENLWLSVAPGNDVVLLMTGRFERGAAANLFYAQGIMPVFLGGSQAMMIGAEPSLQGALARLNAAPTKSGSSKAGSSKAGSSKAGSSKAGSSKAGSNKDGWVTRRARELARDHETWIVNEAPATRAGALGTVRRFALGFKLIGSSMGVDGEAVTADEARATAIADWIEKMRTSAPGVAPLQASREGAIVRFHAGGEFMEGPAGKAALASEFGVEACGLMMAGFPGAITQTVPQEKLLAVQTGMKREQVLTLLGAPLQVTSIQGLETARETWTYQVPFGKQYTVRLDGGSVAAAPVAKR